jgi:hypothetical protein
MKHNNDDQRHYANDNDELPIFYSHDVEEYDIIEALKLMDGDACFGG